jgi:hypothetical protein
VILAGEAVQLKFRLTVCKKEPFGKSGQFKLKLLSRATIDLILTTMYEYPQSYYDSMDLDYDQIMLYLEMGKRKPQNKDEEELLEQIRDIGRRGRSVEIPFNGL